MRILEERSRVRNEPLGFGFLEKMFIFVSFFFFLGFDVVVNLNNLNEEDEQRMEIT